MSKPAEDIKPNQEAITIRVREQDGTETLFKVKRNTKFEKVFAAFYNKRGAAPGSYKFLIEGQRIQAENTPADYDIDNNDQIDALLEQVGGY